MTKKEIKLMLTILLVVAICFTPGVLFFTILMSRMGLL